MGIEDNVLREREREKINAFFHFFSFFFSVGTQVRPRVGGRTCVLFSPPNISRAKTAPSVGVKCTVCVHSWYPVLDTIRHHQRDTRTSQIQSSILRTFVKRLVLFWMRDFVVRLGGDNLLDLLVD